MKKLADAILMADLHIRPGKPQSRIDDFQKAMWDKWHFVLNLSEENHVCPILIAGDIGQEPEWPNWLLRKFIRETRETTDCEIFVIPGQHDLPNHNLELWEKSAFGVLSAAGVIISLGIPGSSGTNEIQAGYAGYLYGFSYGKEIQHPEAIETGRIRIAMSHQLVLENEVQGWEQGIGVSGLSLLKKFPEYDLILTGDNHKSFVVQYRGRFLVNPGSMMRSSADQIDHAPQVYLWYAEERRVEVVYLPCEPNVLTREHIEKQQEKDRRMEAFVQSVKPGELKIKFEDNMKEHLELNPALPEVEKKIWDSIV